MKGSRAVREPGSTYGINFDIIFYCFERRKHDAFLAGIGADSECATNTVRGGKRLYFYWKTVTANAEYGRQLWGYGFYSALRKDPFFHFRQFGLIGMKGRSRILC